MGKLAIDSLLGMHCFWTQLQVPFEASDFFGLSVLASIFLPRKPAITVEIGTIYLTFRWGYPCMYEIMRLCVRMCLFWKKAIRKAKSYVYMGRFLVTVYKDAFAI